MKYIESLKNPQVKQWKKLLTKKERQKTNSYLVEGFHLVEEALKFKEDIIELMYSEEIEIPQEWDIHGLQVTKITSEISKAISDTETAQGIFAVCQMKNTSVNELNGKSFLLLDAVQDPGNIGTMIRTADAAGLNAVVLGEGTVDAYNPKIIRSAQGSHFHINILTGHLDEWINKLQQEQIPVYGTALENGIPFKQVQPQDSFALIVGNEGNGVSKHLLELTKQNLYIPIHGQAESLNVAVAAGILMYYLKK
ncbi:RNA methyltransferase [Heyndrickxia sporothermodurans]|uniref:RNA methyltransferase n=1 Tax=Heyndrickxia sporothermodurans TaxID=46224 RepID=A0AB37HGH3_9BACI|nr:RNA methyltransferase [Heyndrickxia sporothermodurans]MBL5766286.1 RNA methyltransferase [Heyndrickxia sporothermodurans]MBL5769726.1 RNA methyltransferase [Heyndrickxia sporothermodurans]MBL5773426.1 RNA methyltransferase [Heyndrickxia sporothermodurans]MBL5777808.1 RNA methyltransferase [Heyndrickxia sporothermodurans]MBL5781347.1 RNA methyltransferase [Heyndrickxia sporothermodurans]